MICSLCHAPLADGTPAELAFHGATCEGVKAYWGDAKAIQKNLYEAWREKWYGSRHVQEP